MDTNTTESNLPDYTLAAREAVKLLSDTNISMEIVSAVAKIKRAEDKDGRDWPHVEFTVEFVNTKTKMRQEFTYSYGLGLIDWKKAAKHPAYRNSEYLVEKMALHSYCLNDETQVKAANLCLALFRLKAHGDAASIFAAICREGEDAANQTFDDWADTYGYDKDSRKAEAIYQECQRSYTKVSKLVSRAVIKQFAELAARF